MSGASCLHEKKKKLNARPPLAPYDYSNSKENTACCTQCSRCPATCRQQHVTWRDVTCVFVGFGVPGEKMVSWSVCFAFFLFFRAIRNHRTGTCVYVCWLVGWQAEKTACWSVYFFNLRLFFFYLGCSHPSEETARTDLVVVVTLPLDLLKGRL